MRNNFVRCKDQQEPEEIEYRIEDSVTELMTEGISIKTYGIAAYRKGRKLEQRKDVTTEKACLEHLVELCNREKLSLCHLDDVIEDFLGTIYGEPFGLRE